MIFISFLDVRKSFDTESVYGPYCLLSFGGAQVGCQKTAQANLNGELGCLSFLQKMMIVMVAKEE